MKRREGGVHFIDSISFIFNSQTSISIHQIPGYEIQDSIEVLSSLSILSQMISEIKQHAYICQLLCLPPVAMDSYLIIY